MGKSIKESERSLLEKLERVGFAFEKEISDLTGGLNRLPSPLRGLQTVRILSLIADCTVKYQAKVIRLLIENAGLEKTPNRKDRK